MRNALKMEKIKEEIILCRHKLCKIRCTRNNEEWTVNVVFSAISGEKIMGTTKDRRKKIIYLNNK